MSKNGINPRYQEIAPRKRTLSYNIMIMRIPRSKLEASLLAGIFVGTE
jgi:hypothetical protein